MKWRRRYIKEATVILGREEKPVASLWFGRTKATPLLKSCRPAGTFRKVVCY
jgi:hypothetical protein